MHLLHLSNFLSAISFFILLVSQIPKNFQNRITNRKWCLINVLTTNVLRLKSVTSKLKLAWIRPKCTIFAIKLICNNSYKYLIFHQESINVFLKANIKFESSIMSTPRMIAFITPKFKEPFLNSLFYSKFIIVPFIFIFTTKKSRKCFLWCPFNRNPFKGLRGTTRHTAKLISQLWDNCNWNFSIDIIFNLLNRCIRPIIIEKKWCLYINEY